MRKRKNNFLVVTALTSIILVSLTGCSDILSWIEDTTDSVISTDLTGTWVNDDEYLTTITFDSKGGTLQRKFEFDVPLLSGLYYSDTPTFTTEKEGLSVSAGDEITFSNEDYDKCTMTVISVPVSLDVTTVELKLSFGDDRLSDYDDFTGTYTKED